MSSNLKSGIEFSHEKFVFFTKPSFFRIKGVFALTCLFFKVMYSDFQRNLTGF